MSKDADLESDSSESRHDLNESKDETNLIDPASGQCSFVLQNDRVELFNKSLATGYFQK